MKDSLARDRRRHARRRKLASGIDPMVIWIAEFSAGENLTMTDVSDSTGIPVQTMLQWFSGSTQPTIGNLRAAVNALGFELALKRRK